MKGRDFLWCAVNLMLDDEEQLKQLCPQCRQRALEERCSVCGVPLGLGEGAVNGGFDQARFDALRGGKRP